MSRVKDTYWHSLAHLCISAGLKPAEVARVVKNSFPKTEVNGRHVGAYKRRLIQDEDILIPNKPTMNINEVREIAEGLVSNEDMFIYKCVIGSAKRSLKCFEYKFRSEDKDLVSEVDKWIMAIQ